MNICYLNILISLIAFYCIILVYIKYNFDQENFGIIPGINEPPPGNNNNLTKDVHFLDTRYKYSELPPVNPIIEKTTLLTVIPANSDLYNPMGNVGAPTNQLEYSGGMSQILKIPLQMNTPYDEQLRSQEILITDYNKIKYGTC